MHRSIAFALGSVWLVACGAVTESDHVRDVEHRVGTPCLGGDEELEAFGHYSVGEISIADTSEPNLYCIYNHFQGRPGCSYGQTEADLALPDADPARCRTPQGTAVTVEVVPQLSRRRADDVVHLSCRCDGPEPDASYCGCPSGFECAPFNRDLGIGSEHLVGSFCLRQGLVYDADADYGPACDRAAAPGDPAYCG